VLYVTKGLGYSLSASSLIIGAVAAVVQIGALVTGKLADRWGKLRTMRFGLWLYGLTLLIPFVTTSTAILIAAAPVIAFGGGLIMSLPYALLMPLMPEEEHGSLTGFYSVSRGLGTMLGPLLAGVTIETLGTLFDGTEGYATMWLVCSMAIISSIPILGLLSKRAGDRRALAQA
jgi:MFS family permease